MVSGKRLTISGILILCATATVGSLARAQSQDSYNFETKKGHITVVGCLRSENFGKKEKLVLVRPTLGPAVSVSEATCESAGNAATFQLEDAKRASIDGSMVGRWVEITGRLGGVQDSNGLRRFHARESRLVPVAIPPAAEARPVPHVEPPMTSQTYQPSTTNELPAAPAIGTGATSGVMQKKLPKTASQLPLTALLGLVAFAAGLSLRQLSARRGPKGAA